LYFIEEGAFAGSGLIASHFPVFVEVLCNECCLGCKALASVAFEVGSKLNRIEADAFAQSPLIAVHVPASVEVLCDRSFWECNSLM
jgi:hypothetical protein